MRGIKEHGFELGRTQGSDASHGFKIGRPQGSDTSHLFPVKCILLPY